MAGGGKRLNMIEYVLLWALVIFSPEPPTLIDAAPMSLTDCMIKAGRAQRLADEGNYYCYPKVLVASGMR